jgi:beta-galactosidase/beta-glucuronidase
VPGSWNDQVPGIRDELGPAWYERRFEVPPGVLPLGDRDATIRFGSVCYAAQAWLNGQPLGGHVGGHLPFTLACSDALREGENVLVVPPGLVLPVNTHGRVFHPDVSYDFFPYAGIHRRVELVVTPLGGIHDVLLVDRYVLRTGIRTVSVAGDKLLLNGEPVQLRGFGRHEDFPVLGRGTASALNARDLLLMQQIGAKQQQVQRSLAEMIARDRNRACGRR